MNRTCVAAVALACALFALATPLVAQNSSVSGMTPLMRAASAGRVDDAQMLLENGARIEDKDGDGNTALLWATMFGRRDVVKLLLRNGADMNAMNNYGYTALINAATFGDPTVVELMIDQGADLEAKDKYGRTALISAAIHGHARAAEMLVLRGANIEAKNNDGETALMCAARGGKLDVAAFLRDRSAQGNQASRAQRNRNNPPITTGRALSLQTPSVCDSIAQGTSQEKIRELLSSQKLSFTERQNGQVWVVEESSASCELSFANSVLTRKRKVLVND